MSTTNNEKTTILGLKYPVIGLSPMDGVTDSAFRQIVKKYGNPDLIFTEFSNVMGICYAAENTLKRFDYSEMERPIVAQIFGAEPEWFYHAAKIMVALGFDAVDINMGCPASSVSGRGAGAGLIRTPDLAREIIREVKRGIKDFVETGKLTGLKAKQEKFIWATVERMKNGLTKENISRQLSAIGDQPLDGLKNALGIINLLDERHKDILIDVIPEAMSEAKSYPESTNKHSFEDPCLRRDDIIRNRQLVPVSVKTRIGYDVPITEQWIKTVASENPAWISVHGRTLKQMYNGKSDRDELKKAVEATDIPIIVNGDIGSKEEALEVIKQTGAFGALIGRAVFGNPFVFSENESAENDLQIMLEHAKLFDEQHQGSEKAFVQMRKHFGWYTKEISKIKDQNSKEEDFNIAGFNSMKDLRMRLMQVKSYAELREIFNA